MCITTTKNHQPVICVSTLASTYLLTYVHAYTTRYLGMHEVWLVKVKLFNLPNNISRGGDIFLLIWFPSACKQCGLVLVVSLGWCIQTRIIDSRIRTLGLKTCRNATTSGGHSPYDTKTMDQSCSPSLPSANHPPTHPPRSALTCG